MPKVPYCIRCSGGVLLISGGAHVLFFFFQAEDGIRYVAVTGVQTCALPISIVQAEFLKNGFCISYQRFVLFVAFLRMGELEELNLLELMLAEDPAGVFSRGAGFGAEAGRPRGDVDGEFFFGNRFVAIEIVKFYFRSRGKPEIRVLYSKEIGGEFR